MNKLYLLALFTCLPILTFAQLSPGDLSKFHQDLEGLKNCTKCHEIGNKLSGQKCLDCHAALKARIDNNLGLHAKPEYQNCNTCHMEHQGRDYELVYWKEGKEKFDHRLTGYLLEGRHNSLKCEQCHVAKNIQNQDRLKIEKVNLNRTFLGLQRPCLNCHEDEHRGQLDRTCSTCHSMEGWLPADKFDHGRTKFALTGKHMKVTCEKCHPKITDHKFEGNPDYFKFSNLNKDRCYSCHEDIHRNKFGQNCEKCHSTGDWHSVNDANFNHDLTRYPLRGKHETVKCNSCHLPGKPQQGLAFGNCQDCHEDFHKGQFTHRERKGACEECHTVNGFQPSLFTVENHTKTDYPLQESHLAVPCNACHKKEISGQIIPFRFNSTKCDACHRDPHKGEVDKYKLSIGCEYCHFERSWDYIDFDHDKTKFALQGKHQTIKCRECHKKIDPGTENERFQILGLNGNCISCHEDIHAGQFRSTNSNVIHCERCHAPANWKAVNFMHNRDADFKLDGAHEKVECKKCHKTVTRGNKAILLYKPLGKQCKDCHGEAIKFERKIDE